jgi:hypothetical protein
MTSQPLQPPKLLLLVNYLIQMVATDGCFESGEADFLQFTLYFVP